jgi:hypothetical protein
MDNPVGAEHCRSGVVFRGFHGPVHYLLWLPESSGYPHLREYPEEGPLKFDIVVHVGETAHFSSFTGQNRKATAPDIRF